MYGGTTTYSFFVAYLGYMYVTITDSNFNTSKKPVSQQFVDRGYSPWSSTAFGSSRGTVVLNYCCVDGWHLRFILGLILLFFVVRATAVTKQAVTVWPVCTL